MEDDNVWQEDGNETENEDSVDAPESGNEDQNEKMCDDNNVKYTG